MPFPAQIRQSPAQSLSSFVQGRRKAGKCPFLAVSSSSRAVMQDAILSQPVDIEDLGRIGRQHSVCPYYAARRAMRQADVVLTTYSMLVVQVGRGFGWSFALRALLCCQEGRLG